MLLITIGMSIVARGRLTDVEPVRSPDGRYSAAVELLPAKNLGIEVKETTMPNAKVAVVCLRDVGSNTTLHSIPFPDADDSDGRNSASLSWSPDGKILNVQLQIGQLTGFSLYRIVSDKLVKIEELPVPKKLLIEPERRRSRGGRSIGKWTSNDTFVAVDTIAEAEYTYRINKDWKAEIIASRPMEQEAEQAAPSGGERPSK